FDERNKYDNFKQTDKNYDDLKVDTDISLDSLNFNSDTLDEAFNNSTQTDESELDRKLNEYNEDRDEFNKENGHIIEQFMNGDTNTHSLDNALNTLLPKPIKKLFSMNKDFLIDARNNFNN
ncbi:hypothetical protein OAH43_00685, partial [bacterium]|nr:hypothetical protein [bacterium]